MIFARAVASRFWRPVQVSGVLTKMIAVFAEDWLDIGDQKLTGFWSIDVHNQDFNPCSGDEGSLGALIGLMSSWVG